MPDVYAICLTGHAGNRALAEKAVTSLWKNRLPLGDRMFLVADSDTPTSSEIRDKVLEAAGAHEDGPPLFLVLPVVYYAGYNSKSLWEWLSKRTSP